jgi:hypothetical protein
VEGDDTHRSNVERSGLRVEVRRFVCESWEKPQDSPLSARIWRGVISI